MRGPNGGRMGRFELTKGDQNIKNNMSGQHTVLNTLISVITLRGIAAVTTVTLERHGS
jgi:CelD/BcsL family acetyltransferase involved in cellulose biosynthesis